MKDQQKTIEDFAVAAEKENDLKVVTIASPSPSYLLARQISNSRFGHLPDGIAYCKTKEHVKFCIDYCRSHKLPFRVRSGGHQHEGMSSGNGVLVIALSELYGRKMEINAEKTEAWIPVGKSLQEVYRELETHNKIIPGGGCQSVNVGGITQGGGWGRSIRNFGYTCDNILEAEIVLADGRIVNASPENEPDLFWSLKGGGGGNFGIVTRFRFKLSTLAPKMTSFTIHWFEEEKAKQALKCWTDMQCAGSDEGAPGSKELDRRLSSACGFTILPPKANSKRTCRIRTGMGGMFYGPKAELVPLLKSYFGDLLPPIDTGMPDWKENPDWKWVNLKETEHPPKKSNSNLKKAARTAPQASLTGEQQFISEFMNPTGALNPAMYEEDEPLPRYNVLPNAPQVTCDMPHPHKITSAYPKPGANHHELVDHAYDCMKKMTFKADVGQYMVWHCLGGATNDNPEMRAVPYSDRPYLLQVQAWWNNAGHLFADEARNKEYVKWIKDFRENVLKDFVKGAFINFVDRDLIENIHTPEGRLELLKHYYGDNLADLQKHKKTYDPKHLFEFEMSIPPA